MRGIEFGIKMQVLMACFCFFLWEAQNNYHEGFFVYFFLDLVLQIQNWLRNC